MFGVRDGKEHAVDAHFSRDAGGFAGQCNMRLTQFVGQDFHVGPGDLSAPAGADHFEDCFLSRPPTGDELNRVTELSRPFLLGRGEDAVWKPPAVVFQHLGDAAAFDQINAVTEDRHIRKLQRNLRGCKRAAREITSLGIQTASGSRSRVKRIPDRLGEKLVRLFVGVGVVSVNH